MANKITVVCYGKTYEYNSKKDAIKEYMENMACSEGSEKQRYATIVEQLYFGETVCYDGDEVNGIANYMDYKEKGAIKVVDSIERM